MGACVNPAGCCSTPGPGEGGAEAGIGDSERPNGTGALSRPAILRVSVSYNHGAAGICDGGTVTSESRHISEWVDRPADEVYEYALDPANVPQWAPGLGSSVEKVDDQWFVETSEGSVGLAFVPRNEYGVLDHYVTLPLGEVVYNPLRVIPGDGGCEVVFTLRRRPGMSDEDFKADADAVAADLTRLKQVLERR